MSEFIEIQDELEAMVVALGVQKKFSTYEGAIPTGDMLKAEHGWYWPYVVYGFGGKSEAAGRMQGIVSSKEDVKWTSLNFVCVGDTPRTVRLLKDELRKVFEGFTPRPGWGEFTEVLTGDFGISKPDPDLIPLRFGEPIVFKSLTDY